MKNIKSLYPLIIAVVGALMLIITFFLSSHDSFDD